MWIDLIARFLQKLKIACRDFWKQVLLEKYCSYFKGNAIPWIKGKIWIILKPFNQLGIDRCLNIKLVIFCPLIVYSACF